MRAGVITAKMVLTRAAGDDVAQTGDGRELARAAFATGDIAAARDGYLAAWQEDDPLPADELRALSQCCRWLGDVDTCVRALAEAHRRYTEADDLAGAAMAALELGIVSLLRGDEPVGSGWIARAARLAGSLPEGPIHGYLTVVLEVEQDLAEVDPNRGLDAALRVQEVGRRHGDPTLVALGQSGEGRMRIRSGQVTQGIALLDEAMVSVLAGELPDDRADWVGSLYCHSIAACHELGDLPRMARWTEVTERWLRTPPTPAQFAGTCRVHRAQLFILSGEWDQAEREALRVCEDLADLSRVDVGAAWYEVGEARRRRGKLHDAERAFRAAHEHGHDPQPGLALLRLAQGRTAAAQAAIHAALLAMEHDRLGQARLCAAQVEIAIAADDLVSARDAAATLRELASEFASPGLAAMAAGARGATLIAAGDAERALPPLREAHRTWRDLGVPYEVARIAVLLGRAYRALGDAEAANRELDAAVAAFDELGAARDAAEVAALRAGGTRPAGLSAREVEVLRLIADGRGNPDIAAALSISRKTVARHVSNIFAKLAVTSRTEAARYAFDHGLVGGRPD